ncbi:pentatricopeptide repeat-containing protein At5g14080 isoform X2 [Salvia hispanica]|uniref:pentatricopeptide repeat-containing protein At5g14080 isoform X2 n=1 Tax=Salvia hispanica TaxID=49212 RepID=UPI0020091F82|nr:pentatricopeptide repeat-containing protein At5g14080 isoform X2 [Salvia hispanica]
MQGSAAELASLISRTLLVASSRAWTPSHEKTLHQLGCRHSLSPTVVARVIDPFLLNQHSLASGFFNWASQQPGFSHTSDTYQSLLKSLAISRQFNSIDKLLKQIRAQRVSLHPRVYRSVIASLVAGRRTHTAFSLFRDVASIAPEIGPEACNSLLAALASDGNVKSARNVFDEMLNRGVNGSVVALLVVHGLCTELRANDAMFALEELRKRECKPDFMAYRVVAETLRQMGCVVDVNMVLKRKRKLGVAPRASDYRELILQFVTERHLCEAKDLGDVIVSGDFPIEDDVLNVLIGSVSSSDPARAISFLRFMLEKERSPTLLTVINLSENLCKHGKGEELVEVFQLLSTKEYFSDLESYNVMVSYLCKAGRVKEAYQVLQEIKKKGLGPDVSSYNYLLEACCRDDLVRPAKRLWDEMFASGCCGNLESFNILINKFCEVDQVEDACHLFNQMTMKGLEPNESTYKSLLQGICRAKNVDLALEIFNKAVEQDEGLAKALLNAFVLCLCKEGFLLPVSQLLRELTSRIGCAESHLTFLRYLADAGQHSLACKHLQWIADESPEMLHTIPPEFAASLSSS